MTLPNPTSEPHTTRRGYGLEQRAVAIEGAADLMVRSLLDRQQFHDPRGQAARLGISSAHWPLFGLAWPSAARLAERLAARPLVAGERALEIGCGLALPSLVCHRRGIDVTASDIHPLASTFLRANLRLNRLGPMKYRHGAWDGATAPDLAQGQRGSSVVRGRFDLVFGSDLLYERDAGARLAGFIGQHAQPRCEVWIVDPDRGNRGGFNRSMAALGFALTESRLDRTALGARPAYRGRLLAYRRGEQADTLCRPAA